MRLTNVERGHRLLERLEMKMMGLMSGEPPPDVVKTLLYRPAYFGRPFARLVHRALRGPSAWSVGEREWFAAVVSGANTCPFCESSHRVVAEMAMGFRFADPDPRTGPDPRRDPKAAAMAAFLDTLARTPEAVGPEDAGRLRALGIDDQAIEDGICICALFCMINRIANALDFKLQDADGLDRSARSLLRFGYRM